MVNWSLIQTPENLNNFHLCRMHCIVGWLKKIANFTQGDEDGVGQKRLWWVRGLTEPSTTL